MVTRLPVFLAIVRQVIRKMPIKFDFAFVDELQDEQRGELLCHRCDFKFGVYLIGDVPLHVCEPKSSLVQDLSLSGHKYRSIEFAGTGASPHNPIYLQRRGLQRLVLS